MSTLDLRARYFAAPTFAESVASATKNQDLWPMVHRTARVPAELVRRVDELGGEWHLLVLSEDWCGDAVNSVPLLARLAELSSNVDLRVLPRDQNLDLMDAHLTNGTRSIPAAIVLDADFVERGWWGPRPAPLQQWVLTEGKQLPVEVRYPEIRKWYARDRGLTTLEEVVTLLEDAAAKREGGDVQRLGATG
jgi:hypothetical protein